MTRPLTHQSSTCPSTAPTPCCCCCLTTWQHWRVQFVQVMSPNGWNGWRPGWENLISSFYYFILLLLVSNMDTINSTHQISQSLYVWLFPIFSFRTYEVYDVYIPKFSIKTSYKLNDVLTEMGMTDMFGDRANLTGISEGQKLAVSEVRTGREYNYFPHISLPIFHPSFTSLCLHYTVGCAPSYPGCWWGRSHRCSCNRHRHHSYVLPSSPCPEVQSSIYGRHHWTQHRKHPLPGQDHQPKPLMQ